MRRNQDGQLEVWMAKFVVSEDWFIIPQATSADQAARLLRDKARREEWDDDTEGLVIETALGFFVTTKNVQVPTTEDV